MAVNRDRLELFYSISTFWRAREQRFLATIGFEFELCESAFTELHGICLTQTNGVVPRWSFPADVVPQFAIQARAFIDHAVRIQKVVKAIAPGDRSLGELAERFFVTNASLFKLRDSLHHVESRIDADKENDLLQPPCGDLSWQSWQPPNALDTYWVSFGSIVREEFAGPVISTTTTLTGTVNHIRYRAHDLVADLGQAFAAICTLIECVHDELTTRLDEQLSKMGTRRGSDDEARMPAGLSSRLRLEGLEAN